MPVVFARKRDVDPVRLLVFRVLMAVESSDSYANIELSNQLGKAKFDARDAAFATELVSGVARAAGTYDQIIAKASGRPINGFQPAVRVILRIIAHQLLAMRVPTHAAISTGVDLATIQIGQRVTGLVNAISRKIAAHDFDEWLAQLSVGLDEIGRLGLLTHHPRWIVQAYAQILPADELLPALQANNQPPRVCVAMRPGLSDSADFSDAEAAQFSPLGVYIDGDPGAIAAIREGWAGVQDEGSQLVALALARVEAAAGTWLDICAGPGGKSALLAGFAAQNGSRLLANELHHHRAKLVASNLSNYEACCIQADATEPAWPPGTFTRVLADVPCTGLGALRRRPDARWRKNPNNLKELVPLQKSLLNSAIDSASSGGVVAYVTCSPHLAETSEVVNSFDRTDIEILNASDFLAEVPNAQSGRFVQLWPHRHGTDAMFLALIRKR